MTKSSSTTLPPIKPYAFHFGPRVMEYDPITSRTSVIDVRPLSKKQIVKINNEWRFADVSQATHPK